MSVGSTTAWPSGKPRVITAGRTHTLRVDSEDPIEATRAKIAAAAERIAKFRRAAKRAATVDEAKECWRRVADVSRTRDTLIEDLASLTS